jgi:hypothetical protein
MAIVLAEVGLGAGDGANVADLDDLLLGHGCRTHASHHGGDKQLARNRHSELLGNFSRNQGCIAASLRLAMMETL